MKSPFHSAIRLAALVAACGFFTSQNASAAAATWTTGTGSANWSVGTNWIAGTPPNATGDTFTFGATTGATTLNNDQITASNGFTFTSAAPAYTLNGNAITLSGPIANSSSLTQIFGMAITTGNADRTFSGLGGLNFTGVFTNGGTNVITINNTGLVTFSGGLIAHNSGSNARPLSLTGSGNVLVNSIISNLPTNTGGIIYQGTGSLTLTAQNTYVSKTLVSGGGTIVADFNTPNSGNTYITNNIIPTTSNVQIGGNGATTAGATNNGPLSGGTLKINGKSGATNSQTIAGLTLNATNAAAVRVYENGGGTTNLILGAITRNAANTLDFTLPTNGTITTTNTAGIGANNLLSTGAANSAAYATVDGTTWATIPTTGATRAIGALAQGGYQVDAFTSSTGDTDIQTSFSNGATTANTLRFNTSAKTLTLTGQLTLGAGAILNTAAAGASVIADGGSGSVRAGTNGAIIIHDYGTLSIAAALTSNGGSGSLTKAGSGTTTLFGTNTYIGTTAITAGTLQFAKQVSLYNNNTVPGAGTGWVASQIIVGSGATLALNVGGAGEFTASDVTTISGLGGGVATIVQGFTTGSILGLDTTNAVGNTFAYSGVIANPNGGGTHVLGLTKLGANTLDLTGVNTYTGPTLVKAGTLKADNVTGALNSTTSVTINSGGTLLLGQANQITDSAPVTLAGGTLNTGGVNETAGTLSLSLDSVIDLASGASILHFLDSSTLAWTGTLSIWNWSGTAKTGAGTDQLYFGSTISGLAGSQISLVKFYSDSGTTFISGGMMLSTGELVAVPEPPQYAAAIMGMLGLVIYFRNRRRTYSA